MHNITFDMSEFRHHGGAFYDFLVLRKRFFVDTLGWDIPHNAVVEMDQYDTPEAQYSLVLHRGEVIGGARTMPTSVRWGDHGYMLGDALAGKLPGIPAEAMPEEVHSPRVWECTRLVMSDSVVTQADRARCLGLIVDGLADVARRHGAERLISLSPLSLTRALRQLGWAAERLGTPYRNADDGRRYAVLGMPVVKGPAKLPAKVEAPERLVA